SDSHLRFTRCELPRKLPLAKSRYDPLLPRLRRYGSRRAKSGCEVLPDGAVSIQVLVETGLECLQGRAGTGYGIKGHRHEVGVVVGVPDAIRTPRAVLPRPPVAAGGLLRADRRPAAELAGDHVCTAELQGRAIAHGVVQEELVRHLVQAGRA